jgi:glycosyltransferase involved in cell wall biosynthesis
MSELDSRPTVEVLLGTYNGEKYLNEFLDSLVNQELVVINLIVSDDGSVDQTLKILDTYKHKFSGFRLVEGPKKGAALNYLSLLQLSQCEYVAFADQDDIWHSNHLINSVNRLRFHPNTPALSYSAMLEKHENNRKPERTWPKSNQIFDLRSILVQNYARGCTIAMNKKAVELINSRFPKFVSMHDWWVLQVVLVHGNVVFSEKPELIYRVHSSNDTGIPSRSKRYLNFLKQFLCTNKQSNYFDLFLSFFGYFLCFV